MINYTDRIYMISSNIGVIHMISSNIDGICDLALYR